MIPGLQSYISLMIPCEQLICEKNLQCKHIPEEFDDGFLDCDMVILLYDNNSIAKQAQIILINAKYII